MAAKQGEVWLVDLNPPGKGHEQHGKRPAVIVSVDHLNLGPAGLVIAVPITSVEKKIPTHVRIDPPEGGLKTTSWAKSEDVRSISTQRLLSHWGDLEHATLAKISKIIHILTYVK